MSIAIDAKVGDVIRVFLKYGKGTCEGAVESFDPYRIVLRPQEFIRVKDTNVTRVVDGVTVDSQEHLGINIDRDSIFAWEPASYDSLANDYALSTFLCFDERLLKGIKKEISECKYFPRELHYYDKDGFCINTEKDEPATSNDEFEPRAPRVIPR